MGWQECASDTVGKIVSSGGTSFICSNADGMFAWKETSDMRTVVFVLILLSLLLIILKLFRSKTRSSRRR